MTDQPIKVLHVLGYFDRGGAESMVMDLFRNCDPDKVQFGFVVHGDKKGAFEKEVTDKGADVFRVPDYTGINHVKYKQAWKTIFENHPEYKIIHGHVRSTANIYLKMAQEYNVKTIAHSHNTSSGKGLSATVKNVFQSGIAKHTDQFIGCSKEAGEWLFGEKICKQSNFHVLNNAINAEQFKFDEAVRKSKRQELDLNDKLVIGHVGRFHEQKNHTFLIDIFHELTKLNENSILLLVGAGDKKEMIESKVQNLGLADKVRFLGLRADVNELMQAMDVFLFPSLFEGLPVTLVETQAAGLPAVVSDTITRDIQLTPYISYLSLETTPVNWAEKLLEVSKTVKRESTLDKIKAANYDIETSAKWYTQFIQDMGRGNRVV